MKRTIISILLVACLATMCFVGGTFAKYTSTVSSAAETAKVAKWSFTEDSEDILDGSITFDLFNTVGDTDAVGDDAENDDDVADAGSGNPAIIAPGTTGAFAFDITNASEVNATYSIAFTVTNANNIPIVITYNETAYAWDKTAGAFKNGENVLTVSGFVDMGTDITDELTWTWAFETSGDQNTADTTLGKTEATISITATCTFTQVD